MFAMTQARLQRDVPNPRFHLRDATDSRSACSSNTTCLVSSLATRMVAASADQENPGGRPAPRPALPSLKPGASLGPFLLERLLGQGAQGEVWKAVRRGPDRKVVALKVLGPLLAKQPHRLAQFRREAERGARLRGPALLRVLGFDESQGLPYMVMPYVRGVSLLQVIRARLARRRGEAQQIAHPLISAEEALYQLMTCRIMVTTARALGRLHASRIVHRDIKPANILLDGHSAAGVYLCDLGLGRDLEFATAEQMRDGAGTPMYMPPERLLRARADEILCDLYAMGVTLFEALTLARPFQIPIDLHAGLLSSFLANAAPRRPRRLNPSLPAELEDVIMKAMAHEPENRHQSAAELACELERFLSRRKHPSAGMLPPHVRPAPSYLEA